MLTAKDIREKRFEKASWGYRPEDIDEYLGQVEATLQEYENEREDSNHKITILAEKVREYMKDEEAIKDALLGAQKEGRRVIAEANEKAEQIVEKAKEEAAVLIDEATRQHDIAMEKNRAEIAREKEALVEARKMVADFKRSLFDMYKEHLEMISAMPESEDDEVPAADEASAVTEQPTETALPVDTEVASEPTDAEIDTAFESRFSDIQSEEAEAAVPGDQ